MRFLGAVLFSAGFTLPLAAQGDLTDLCASRSPAMGPDVVLPVELGAGANAARSTRLPWRLTGRVMPTWIVDRVSGLGVGAIVGGTTSQPGGGIVGARLSFRLMSLLNLTGFRLPGAEIQGAAEYGYVLLGKDHAHSLAGTVGLELTDLARVTLRTNRIFAYNTAAGRVPGQWVLELGVGRSFSLHTPPPPGIQLPNVDPNLIGAYNLGRTVALAATLIREVAPTDSTPRIPAACNQSAIAGLTAFAAHDAANLHTKADLLAALRARGLTTAADQVDLLYPSEPPVPEPRYVGGIVNGILSIFHQ
ncbi:MAG TPA: hypothetical protein VNH46_09950 [Gemmatimonadales bacterium]|nr:hypothetical protein [Gemmatimonadales bacterium]